jgi:ribosomal protein S18 acetylase RimI-like enzyme
MASVSVGVRSMTEADIDAVSAVRVRGWQAAYAGILPQGYLDAMSVEADAARRREFFAKSLGRVENLVAVDADDAVVGWAAHGPYRGEDAASGEGELYAIYVRPDLVGSGIGRALTDAVLASAEARGFSRVRLWVLADNARARRFYEKAGFAPDGVVQEESYDGTLLPEVRYARGPAGR